MNPVLRRFVANQYQAILLGGAAAFSALTWSPLPLLLWMGGQFVAAPFFLERLKRRIEIERKHAERKVETLTQEDMFRELLPDQARRFVQFRALCERIASNYRGLSPASQEVLADQSAKFDSILVSCLRRLWLLRKYDEIVTTFDDEKVKAEIAELESRLDAAGTDTRVRGAWEQNLEIKRRLLETAGANASNRSALEAELDSLESLLQLLLQKSVAATDAQAFAAELDDALRQAEADAASIEEMEQLVGAMPEARSERLSETLRSVAVPAARPPQRIPVQGPPPRR